MPFKERALGPLKEVNLKVNCTFHLKLLNRALTYTHTRTNCRVLTQRMYNKALPVKEAKQVSEVELTDLEVGDVRKNEGVPGQ